MKVLFLLSAEHPLLPRAEAVAALQALGIEFEISQQEPRVLVVEGGLGDKDIRELARRLAFTHLVGRVAFSSAYEELPRQDYSLGFEGSFAIRVRKAGRKVSSQALEREIGGRIAREGKKVDLEDPDNLVEGVAGERFHLLDRAVETGKRGFRERRPHLRPYYRPGAMLPRLSRAVVNLTRVKQGEEFADPFCGSGSFLIEAGLMGARVYGFDLDKRAVKGARKNLLEYGIESFTLAQKDFFQLQGYENHFHALAADPPYGISSSIRGEREKFYAETAEKMEELLKPGHHAAMVVPQGCFQAKDFKVVERYYVRVHRSLTREILVMKKWR